MTIIDYSIVLIFILWAIYTGLSNFKQASKNTVEYFLAGRSLNSWQAGFSMAATQFAADTPLLVAGLIATGGITSIWRLQIYGVSFIFITIIFAPMWARSRVLTDIEITEIRYSGNFAFLLRMLKAIHLGTLFNCSVLAMVLLAAGRIYEIFLPWYIWLPDNVFSYVVLVTNHFPDFVSSSVDSQTTKSVSASNYFSLLITMLVTWSYSTTGGLRSVVRTDMSQLLLMFVGTISFAVILYLNATSSQLGLREVLNESYGKVKASDLLSLFNNELGIFALLVIGIQWIAQVNSDGSGYLAQRILACRSESEAQKACLIFTVTQIVIRSFFWIIIGVSLLILYPANSNGGSLDVSYRELTYVLGMKDYLPVGLAGIMLTAMLAALASTIDTHLNWGSSYWTNDLYHRGLCDRILKRVPSDSELVFVARIANLVILVLAVTIAVNISSIQKAWEFSLLFGSGFGLVLMLRWLWWRVTVYCEIAAGVGSIMTIFFVYDIESSIALLSVFAISSILVVFFAFFGPREDEETLLKFYRMIKPVGFWGPIAQKCGDSASLSLNKLKSDILKVFSLVFLIFGSYILLVKTFF